MERQKYSRQFNNQFQQSEQSRGMEGKVWLAWEKGSTNSGVRLVHAERCRKHYARPLRSSKQMQQTNNANHVSEYRSSSYKQQTFRKNT